MAAVRIYQRQWVLIRLPVVAAALALIAWLWFTVWPLPPNELTLSAGRTDGVYHVHALRYAERFAERGVTLRIETSEGAEENLARLRGLAAPAADLALVQGGLGYAQPVPAGSARVETIARVDIEPLWIFTRLTWLENLQQLQGLRVSLGPRGSGGRRLALTLLEQVRLKPDDLEDSELAGLDAQRALARGLLDVVVLVAAPQSPVVQTLLKTPGIQLVQLRRTAALTERLPYLQPRLLPQGALDASGRWPARDITVLTTTASLLTRADLHPALQRLAAQVAHEVHGGAGVFHAAGTFPSLKRIEFLAAEEARRTLVHGLPWLEERMPLRDAQIVTRLLMIVLPVVLLALWAMRLVPAYLRWVLENRITRWYGELRYIEHDLVRDTASELDLTKYLRRLASMEKRLADFVPPADLMARCFALRQHIDFVRASVLRRRGR